MSEEASVSSERGRFEAWAGHNNLSTERTGSRPNSLYSEFETHTAWTAWQAASAGRQELLDALTLMCRAFPTDYDMVQAGWSEEEVEAACRAHDKARAIALRHKGA